MFGCSALVQVEKCLLFGDDDGDSVVCFKGGMDRTYERWQMYEPRSPSLFIRLRVRRLATRHRSGLLISQSWKKKVGSVSSMDFSTQCRLTRNYEVPLSSSPPHAVLPLKLRHCAFAHVPTLTVGTCLSSASDSRKPCASSRTLVASVYLEASSRALPAQLSTLCD